jgi:phosphoglycerol geranylgeranyltransferase
MKSDLQSTLSAAKQENRCLFAMLIDPDTKPNSDLERRVKMAEASGVNMFFVGGSLLKEDFFEETIRTIKSVSSLPVVLFPGSALQVSAYADAILFLSLISGRNPDLLIGQQVIAAPYVKKSGLEVLSTGYMLVDGGTLTTAHYVSQTSPIPAGNISVAVNTAVAGELLGLSCLYLDCGSGAKNPVSPEMIQAVSEAVDIPVIVGGGMRTEEQIRLAAQSGANVVVVGNAIEENENLIYSLVGSLTAEKKF